MMSQLIRQTQSVCPICFKEIPAQIVEDNGSIYQKKECPEHGQFSTFLSRHPDYYKGLNDFYFPLFNNLNLNANDYIIHLTDKCNLSCPICLASANNEVSGELTQEQLKDFLKDKKGYKINLMGAEPTMRTDLPEIIHMVKQSGNNPAISSNGLKIGQDPEYAKTLQKAGLQAIYLQFDGLNDNTYINLRGQKLLDLKKQTLINLKNTNIQTILVTTIGKGINEKEIIRVLDFAIENKTIQGVLFLGCRFIGKAKELPIDNCLMPDEIIDILEEQTQGKIARTAIFHFQKICYALFRIFKVRKCFYAQHFMLARTPNGYKSADQLLNLPSISRKLDKFKTLEEKKSKLAIPYLMALLLSSIILNRNILYWAKEIAAFILWKLHLADFPHRGFMIGFISSCDAYSYDTQIAQNCGVGTVSKIFGNQKSGSTFNIMLEKHLEESKTGSKTTD